MKQTIQEATVRDRFIVEKYQEGFSGEEVRILLIKNHFRRVSRTRIYQILEKNGVEVRTK